MSRRLIIGLGNPGDRYRDTRHNLGFRVVERLAERLGGAAPKLECGALVSECESDLLLARPQTYMNRSGYSGRCLVERYGLDRDAVLVVYDDTELPLGRLRLRAKGGPGGHRGMESLIQNLQSERIARLRLGVGVEEGERDEADLADFVLAPFKESELPAVEELVERAADACRSWLDEGVETAMNRHNG